MSNPQVGVEETRETLKIQEIKDREKKEFWTASRQCQHIMKLSAIKAKKKVLTRRLNWLVRIKLNIFHQEQ